MPAPLGAAPVAVLVAAGEDYPSAARAASGRAGDLVFRGSGDSMTPIYRNGTSVVVTPVRYGQLRKGMAVVYVNRRGQYVAHLLVARKAGGWVAVGAANSSADGELVTPDNLIGVVTQAFTAAEGSERMALQEAAVGMQVAALR